MTTRDVILSTALQLFGARGFHAVAIDEIGAASGVSGPAIYRHFNSKEDILSTLMKGLTDELLEGSRAALESSDSAESTLHALARFHARFVIDRRVPTRVLTTEGRHLSTSELRRFRARQRAYRQYWVDAIIEIRNHISEAEAVIAAHGAIGLLNSIADVRTSLPRDELEALVTSMSLRAVYLF